MVSTAFRHWAYSLTHPSHHLTDISKYWVIRCANRTPAILVDIGDLNRLLVTDPVQTMQGLVYAWKDVSLNRLLVADPVQTRMAVLRVT